MPNPQQDKYLKRKLRDIESSVAIVCGVANMTGVMFGKCTDGVIKSRDEMTKRIIKTVMQLLKRYGK